MLVIIVSLGFGIVKPRLGPTLHRIVGIGFLYFIIASTEAVLRVIKPKNDISSGTMLAGIPLAVIDRYGQFLTSTWCLITNCNIYVIWLREYSMALIFKKI